MSSSSGDDNVFAPFMEFSNTIDVFRHHCFHPNKDEMFSRLKDKAERTLDDLERIPIYKRIAKNDQAMHMYLRGKILDAISIVHNREAEHDLTEALKLNHNIPDAWLILGTCVWKRGDHDKAKSCYQCGLQQDPKNKELLRLLSVVERRQCRGDTVVENRDEIINDCLKHAKEATALDVQDGLSWYALGNASLTAFHMTGGWDRSMLMQSLKSFKNAVRDDKMKLCADVCYNCSIVYKLLENYMMALTGFQSVGSTNSGARARQKQLNLCEVFDKIESLLKDLNDAKRLPSPTSSLPTVESLASSLASVDLNPSYERTTVDHLTDGVNRGKALIGKVLFLVQNPGKVPLYYVVCDPERTCFVITVYGLRSAAIKVEDQVTLLDPFYHFFDFEWKGQHYQFKSVRVDNLKQLRVNGAVLVSPEHVKHRSMFAQLNEA